MKNSDKPAHPFTWVTNECNVEPGLTKREYFAALAMQGMIANAGYYPVDWSGKHTEAELEWIKERDEQIARQSSALADALLAELEKPTEQ